MAKFLILSLCVAMGAAAPGQLLAPHHTGHIAGVHHASSYAVGPTHVQEQVHAGPAIAQTHVQHGVVGSRTVQVGHKTVQVGHQYRAAGQTVEQPAPYSYVAGAPSTSQSTRQLPLAALPHASPVAAIPPAPRNLGPAPADTVTHERIAAPVRTHTRITPVQTNIIPKLNVNKVPYDVPVPVPTPVERPYTVLKHVQKPYHVEVPVPVDVPVPHKVHPVQKIVKTPVIEKNIYTVQQPIVKTAVHTAQVGYTHSAVAAAPVAAAGYAVAAPAAAAGYAVAAPAAHIAAAPAAAAGYAVAAPALAHGYNLAAPAAHVAAAAPVAIAH